MSKKINSDFINAIKHWMEIDNTISQSNSQIKNLKEKRDKLEGNILRYITVNDLKNTKLTLGNNCVSYNDILKPPSVTSYLGLLVIILTVPA